MRKTLWKAIPLVLSLLLLLTLIPFSASAADFVPYLDTNGNQQISLTAIKLTGGGATTLITGWYLASGTLNYTGTITVSGDVHLILGDGCDMTVSISASDSIDAAINVTGENSLTIYAQSAENGMGILTAKGGYYGAGIGGNGYSSGDGNGEAGGSITINGGNITATSNDSGAGIGGGGSEGIGGPGGKITINGGVITASSRVSAGIGGGRSEAVGNIGGGDGGDIVINGGVIDARSTYGAGIGGAWGGWESGGSGGEITINGGIVTAISDKYGAGIGGAGGVAAGGAGGTITINGGTVKATGGRGSAGIGGGSGNFGEQNGGSGGNIVIYNGNITALGGNQSAGIGGGWYGGGGAITISGGEVTAIAGGSGNAAAIGRGDAGALGTVVVEGVYDYWVNTANTIPGEKTGMGPFIYSDSYKYIRLVAPFAPEPVFRISYEGFKYLVKECAANIPVKVEADNPDGLRVFTGLFVDGENIGEAEIINGRALIRAQKIITDLDFVYLMAWLENSNPETASAKEIPMRILPDDIWTPEFGSSINGTTTILFADPINLASSATVKIGGVSAQGFRADASVLYIDAGVLPGQIIEMKGIKYPDLFPSYSFTFRVKAE